MSWKSAIYRGQVHHRRRQPREHDFRYPLFMMYLDLDELPQLFRKRWLWSNERSNLATFRRHDHHPDQRGREHKTKQRPWLFGFRIGDRNINECHYGAQYAQEGIDLECRYGSLKLHVKSDVHLAA